MFHFQSSKYSAIFSHTYVTSVPTSSDHVVNCDNFFIIGVTVIILQTHLCISSSGVLDDKRKYNKFFSSCYATNIPNKILEFSSKAVSTMILYYTIEIYYL